MTYTVRIFIALNFLFLYAQSALALGGSASCHYELYTPEHFAAPVITPTFSVDLSKTEEIGTENPAIKRIIRLRIKPATVDGKAMTHFSFSQTYDGAHSGAVIPATNGMHVMIISKDNSDLIAAYLFCDLKISTLSATLEDDEYAPAALEIIPEFSQVRCVNLKDNHPYSELQFAFENGRRYKLEIIKQNASGQTIRESLGISELYTFPDNLIKLAGLGAVVEFQLQNQTGQANPARVHMNNPYYESNSWLCKGIPNGRQHGRLIASLQIF